MPAEETLFAPAAGLSRLAAGIPPPGKGEKAARDFEAILLTQLLDSLQKTFSGVSQDQTPGASDYRLMATQALAAAVAQQGGIGIARLLLSHLPTAKIQNQPGTGG